MNKKMDLKPGKKGEIDIFKFIWYVVITLGLLLLLVALVWAPQLESLREYFKSIVSMRG
ncbi:MAG: hypothetical protein ABII01_06480 [Candidatus Woesearchaeota archaeon]